MKYRNDCQHTDRTVARMRGTKVRKRCTHCGNLGKWEPGTTAPRSTPNPKIPVQVSLPEPTTAQVDYAAWKVADLRDAAKRRGMTGYSKMKRDDLIAALS